MFDVGNRQKMTDLDSKWATTKCIATALVCQLCWVSCCFGCPLIPVIVFIMKLIDWICCKVWLQILRSTERSRILGAEKKKKSSAKHNSPLGQFSCRVAINRQCCHLVHIQRVYSVGTCEASIFDSKVIGRFENFRIESAVPAPLLVVSLIKQLKPLTALN